MAHRHAAMSPYYRALVTCTTVVIESDQTLLEKMEKENEEELKKLDERLQEAEKQEGEMEISDALKARANFFTRIGDKVGSGSVCPWTVCNDLVRVGEGHCSPRTGARKDARRRVENRHCAHSDSDWVFFQRQ